MRYVKHNAGKFLYGKYDDDRALAGAANCAHFTEDCEDECVSDTPVSCFNCRYRRWTQESFICMKGVIS
jgi:hypothetical protein